MADCDCQYCHREDYCPVVYEGYNCRINTIKAAKAVVDDEFKAFLAKMEVKNKDMTDDSIEMLIDRMKWIIRDSEEQLPEWALREETDKEDHV